MQIDRPAPDIASARKRHLRAFVFAEQRSDQIIRRTDFPDIFIVNIHIADKGSVDLYGMRIRPFHHRADLLYRVEQHIDISDIWYILYCYGLIRHDGGGKNR